MILGSNTNPNVPDVDPTYILNLSMSGPSFYYASVNWGDNTPNAPQTLYDGDASIIHSYSSPGTYQIEVSVVAVTDLPDGDESSVNYVAVETIHVVSLQPPANPSNGYLDLTSTSPNWTPMLAGNASSPLTSSGPEGANPYVSGGPNQTPEIPGPDTTTSMSEGLIGGADLFGIVGINLNAGVTPVSASGATAPGTPTADTLEGLTSDSVVSDAIANARPEPA